MSALRGVRGAPIGGRGFGQLLKTELLTLRREPMVVFWALIFPVGLLVLLGSTNTSTPQPGLGGLTLLDVYTPVEMTFTLALLSLSIMPATLASYRDKGYLRRLSTTPIGATRLIAVEIVIVLGLAACIIVLLVLVSHFAYSVSLPRDFGGFLLTLLLTGLAMSSVGMLIAAVSTSQRVAGIVGSLMFFVMMFFAGLWVPQQKMGHTLQTISHYTPLGAAVPAIEKCLADQWAGTQHLLVLLVYAVLASRLAIRFFRWDR